MSRSVTHRFNYTRRAEILQKHVEIDLRADGDKVLMTLMRLSLEKPSAHADADWRAAKVTLEAWRTDSATYQRFDVGSVAQVVARTPPFTAELTEFADEHNITFRIKVVGLVGKRILAEADRILANQDERRRDELIQVFPKDLGELPWTVDWSDEDEGPKVFVNVNIERNRDLLVRDAVVRGLFLPSVLREVLWRAATDAGRRESTWAKRWLEMGVRLTGQELPEADSDTLDDWIAGVLARFAESHRLSSEIEEHFKKEEAT